MESGKRSKNFTEREKMLLIEISKEFVCIIDNKKTDGTTIEAKKKAWMELTNKFNAVSETGNRSEKQLHALYDNIKKKARKNMSDDKAEIYKTGGGTFTPKTTVIDEKIVTLLSPQFKPLENEFDSSAPYYKLDNTQEQNVQDIILIEEKEVLKCSEVSHSLKRPSSPNIMKTPNAPKQKKICLTEIKKNNVNTLSSSIIKRKNQKQHNEDSITGKKLEILEIQKQNELLKLEKTRLLLDMEIELKQIALESAKLDLELKKKNVML